MWTDGVGMVEVVVRMNVGLIFGVYLLYMDRLCRDRLFHELRAKLLSATRSALESQGRNGEIDLRRGVTLGLAPRTYTRTSMRAPDEALIMMATRIFILENQMLPR
jgi:hypothetical protein